MKSSGRWLRPTARNCGSRAWGTPIDGGGQRQYVQFLSRGLVGVAAEDGKFLWRYDAPASRSGINITTPLYHDGQVFASAAYNTGAGLVKLSKDEQGGVKAAE